MYSFRVITSRTRNIAPLRHMDINLRVMQTNQSLVMQFGCFFQEGRTYFVASGFLIWDISAFSMLNHAHLLGVP